MDNSDSKSNWPQQWVTATGDSNKQQAMAAMAAAMATKAMMAERAGRAATAMVATRHQCSHGIDAAMVSMQQWC